MLSQRYRIMRNAPAFADAVCGLCGLNADTINDRKINGLKIILKD